MLGTTNDHPETDRERQQQSQVIEEQTLKRCYDMKLLLCLIVEWKTPVRSAYELIEDSYGNHIAINNSGDFKWITMK